MFRVLDGWVRRWSWRWRSVEVGLIEWSIDWLINCRLIGVWSGVISGVSGDDGHLLHVKSVRDSEVGAQRPSPKVSSGCSGWLAPAYCPDHIPTLTALYATVYRAGIGIGSSPFGTPSPSGSLDTHSLFVVLYPSNRNTANIRYKHYNLMNESKHNIMWTTYFKFLTGLIFLF